MVDKMFAQVIDWIDAGFDFLQKYSNVIVWGVVAMMVAKLAKFKINIGKK